MQRVTRERFIEAPDLAALDPKVIAEDDALRSHVVGSILNATPSRSKRRAARTPAPRLVQFWDTRTIPADVLECLETWRAIEAHGIERVLFDSARARRYIARHYSPGHLRAFERCHHPAMRSDYFRLCFMAREGGIYVDADDEYLGGSPVHLLRDDVLLVQALCYDRETDSMVPSPGFVGYDRPATWTYYVNNNPLIAPAGHPILESALARATRALLSQEADWLDIQSTTGPGNLTACLVRHAIILGRRGEPFDFVVLTDWDSFAVSRWPLAYRSDSRNWRLWRPPPPRGVCGSDLWTAARVNVRSLSGGVGRLRSELAFRTRKFATLSRSTAFGLPRREDSIGRVIVINLDRRPDRWRHVSSELGRIGDRTGRPLLSLTRRFSAVDARYLEFESGESDVATSYLLSDHLRVEPVAAIADATCVETTVVEMTTEEVAVALSHVAVWRQVAMGDVPYTLILEDDAYFGRGFARKMDAAWAALLEESDPSRPADLLYLSFSEVSGTVKQPRLTRPIQRPDRGIWQLSGYVLSRRGARRLLAMLPVRGPVDLWVNLNFDRLDVRMTDRPLIDQRPSLGSSNAYSILPILSQLGVLTREKPALFAARDLPRPIVASGDPGTGLTSIAAALAMIGYRCCSDFDRLPGDEEVKLVAGREDRAFDAYVNIGSLRPKDIEAIALHNRSARFIRLDAGGNGMPPVAGPPPDDGRTLILPVDHPDKWGLLSSFLGCEYPALPYPRFDDIGQRETELPTGSANPTRPAVRLRSDSSPWIVPVWSWPGVWVARAEALDPVLRQDWTGQTLLKSHDWHLRADTFPSNLALFQEGNAGMKGDDLFLCLRMETTAVRALTSAALASQLHYQYGRFAAELRAPKGSGLVTGIFLHRNGPRQEIDIELLGRAPTTLLANVFFNPGGPGTKLEYGYRGTPTAVDLGFDASADFHLYEIDWQPNAIRWLVDGVVVHERVIWHPTPIPDQPLEFNINLWHSRSTELAGKLDARRLPAQTMVRRVSVDATLGSPERRPIGRTRQSTIRGELDGIRLGNEHETKTC